MKKSGGVGKKGRFTKREGNFILCLEDTADISIL